MGSVYEGLIFGKGTFNYIQCIQNLLGCIYTAALICLNFDDNK